MKSLILVPNNGSQTSPIALRSINKLRTFPSKKKSTVDVEYYTQDMCLGYCKSISSGSTHRVRACPIWSDRTGASAAYVLAVRRIRTDVSVHQIWVTDASARTDALSARVFPRESRPHLATAQWARAMLVKGWRAAWPSAVPPRRFVL
jgi:hypothetical protein